VAREVQIITWCDRCLTEGQQVNATEYAGLNSTGVRVLVDLCEECQTNYVAPALDVFDTFGRSEPKTAHQRRHNTPTTGPCPECGKEFSSTQSLGMHRWRKHGVPSQHRNKKKDAA